MTTLSLNAESNSRLFPLLFVILLKYLDITAKLDIFKSSDSSFETSISISGNPILASFLKIYSK